MFKIPAEVIERNVIKSHYLISYPLYRGKKYFYTYFLDYRYDEYVKNNQIVIKKINEKNEERFVISSKNFFTNFFQHYQKTSLIPPLYSEFIEAYINEQKQTDRILPMIKLLQDKKPDALRELNERQEVFDKEEFNEKLNLIQMPENDCNFFIQPISINGHFSNIIISNENNEKKYYLYDSYIGNHRIINSSSQEAILNEEIFNTNKINIEIFKIANLQKETNACGFFCLSFALLAEQKENITRLKSSINDNTMQKQVCFDVMELLGKEKISKAMNKTEKEIISSINLGQGFGRYIQLSQEEDVEQIQDIPTNTIQDIPTNAIQDIPTNAMQDISKTNKTLECFIDMHTGEGYGKKPTEVVSTVEYGVANHRNSE